MDLQLRGQMAVVIGGASGIGLAIGRAFSEEGAHVALLDRNEAVEQVAREVSASTRGFRIDATNFVATKSIAETLRSELGEVRHVVYAAGCGSGKFGFPFWNLEPEDWDSVLRVNLIGAVNVAHAFAPSLAEARMGTITFISSVAGQIGSQTDPPYSAAKAGLLNFAECAAKDLAPYNVRVNTICPGMIQTPLNRSVWKAWHDRQLPEHRLAYEEWAGEKVRTVIPLKRWQTPEDIAAMSIFLASEKAANITGQTLNVDGGWVMHW
jgi:2-hydroxycyclohexanecarboxyl-CoA dehydrogenase